MSACSRSTQSGVKIIRQCKAFALYQEELKVTARAGGDCNYAMLVIQDLGLDLLKIPTVRQNKGFIIPTFCRPSADFEVVEDRLGSRYTPTSIRLFVNTQMTRSIALTPRYLTHLAPIPHRIQFPQLRIGYPQLVISPIGDITNWV